MTNRVTGPVPSTADVTGSLDWQTFSAASFPGRRRHDLEALTAYGAYRRSHAVDRQSSDEVARIDAARREAASTAVEEWEAEGGAAR